MIFITGPLYSGKRTFAQRLPGTRIAEVQALAAEAEDLEKLAEELSAYDIVMATSPWIWQRAFHPIAQNPECRT